MLCCAPPPAAGTVHEGQLLLLNVRFEDDAGETAPLRFFPSLPAALRPQRLAVAAFRFTCCWAHPLSCHSIWRCV